jgi:hypothetical protein
MRAAPEMPMSRFEPYYDDESDGVHFEVRLVGCYAEAYISRALLSQCSGENVEATACIARYLRNRPVIDAAVERRARGKAPDIVLLRLEDLARAPWR